MLSAKVLSAVLEWQGTSAWNLRAEYRNYENWKTAEEEKKPSKAVASVRKSGNDCDISTLVSSLNREAPQGWR